MPEAIFCQWLSWKCSNKHAYQVSLPCIRSEEVAMGKKCLRPFFVHSRHGNTEIHMRTKFHLHALHGVQV